MSQRKRDAPDDVSNYITPPGIPCDASAGNTTGSLIYHLVCIGMIQLRRKDVIRLSITGECATAQRWPSGCVWLQLQLGTGVQAAAVIRKTRHWSRGTERCCPTADKSAHWAS